MLDHRKPNANVLSVAIAVDSRVCEGSNSGQCQHVYDVVRGEHVNNTLMSSATLMAVDAGGGTLDSTLVSMVVLVAGASAVVAIAFIICVVLLRMTGRRKVSSHCWRRKHVAISTALEPANQADHKRKFTSRGEGCMRVVVKRSTCSRVDGTALANPRSLGDDGVVPRTCQTQTLLQSEPRREERRAWR